MLAVRDIKPSDRLFLEHFMQESWGSTRMVSRGVLHDVLAQPGLLALSGAGIVGVLTYVPGDDACEVLTIDALTPRQGIGRFLLDQMEILGRTQGWRRLWLITTNDNVPAQKFYKDAGWSLVTVHKNALAVSRQLKPEIPLIGINDIPITDEWEYEKRLIT